MKRIAKYFTALLATLVLVCASVLVGCSGNPSVVSIVKTGTRGTDGVYTITYSDGSTSELVIEGGSDGQDVTANDLWQTYVAETGDDISYEDFLEKYLTIESGDNSAVIGESLLSSLKVYAEFIEPVTIGNFPMNRVGTAVYTGGGVIYSMDDEYTYILTNYHVVYNASAAAENANENGTNIARKIVCNLYGSESVPTNTNDRDEDGYTVVDYGDYAIECEYVGGSVNSDIAVLRADTEDVKAINSQAQAVTVAEGYSVGDAAYTIGNPEGEGISVTQGIVSIADDYITLNIDGTSRQYRSIRIDTPLYQGNSGGGLFNAEGELIGIANAGNSTEENINYAIPLSIVTGTADNIIYYSEDGDASTNGVYTIDFCEEDALQSKNSSYVYDADTGMGEITEDVILGSVSGISSEIGLEEGDIIRSFIIGRDGENVEYEIDRTFDISDLLYIMRPGDTLTVKYERDGRELNTSEISLQSSDFASVA